jgi:hypothetical protein
MDKQSLEPLPTTMTATVFQPAITKRTSNTPTLFPKRRHLPYTATKKELWVAEIADIPSYSCSPWDFYEPFLYIASQHSLVLCNEGSEIRAINAFDTASVGEQGNRLPQIRYPNFVKIYEEYVYEDKICVISEHVGLSIADLLQHSIIPREAEIAFIISQVSQPDSI